MILFVRYESAVSRSTFRLLDDTFVDVFRFIKMSSPKFNDITGIGCLFCYVEVFLSTYINSVSAEHDLSPCYVSTI